MKKKYWVRLKGLMLRVLTKKEEWKKREEHVEEYMENLEPGLRHITRAVAKATEGTDKVWFDGNVYEWWDSYHDLYQLLNRTDKWRGKTGSPGSIPG